MCYHEVLTFGHNGAQYSQAGKESWHQRGSGRIIVQLPVKLGTLDSNFFLIAQIDFFEDRSSINDMGLDPHKNL